MNVTREEEVGRLAIDGDVVVIQRNIWSDGGVNWDAYLLNKDGSQGMAVQDESFDHVPDEDDIRTALEHLEDDSILTRAEFGRLQYLLGLLNRRTVAQLDTDEAAEFRSLVDRLLS